MILYFHQSLDLNNWGDGWSNGTVQPGGQYMSEEPPKQSSPSYSVFEILKNYYCYSDPPITGTFDPGNFIIELWVGNPEGPINGLLQIHLELTDDRGKQIIDLGKNFLQCRTKKKGPALFKSNPFKHDEKLSIDRCRFKITLTPIDSLDLKPYIFWDSYENGASRLLSPLFSPPAGR
jgi:hypothetical protein